MQCLTSGQMTPATRPLGGQKWRDIEVDRDIVGRQKTDRQRERERQTGGKRQQCKDDVFETELHFLTRVQNIQTNP